MAFRIASATVVFALVSTFAYAQAEQQRLIVGVTDMGRAERELPAQAQVRLKIGISRAFAVTGDPERLRRLPFVRYVEPDPVDAVHIVQAETLEYGVNKIDAEVLWGGSQGATTVIPGQGGFGAKVAILDTGIDCNHEDLAGACGPGANFVSLSEQADDHGHGTHVAGIVAARANGVGTIGVAPEATVLPVKVMNAQGSGAWSWVAAGIDWAVNTGGAHVISMSLSGSPGSQAVADAVAAAQAAGVLVVSAAGNSGCCNTVGYPAKYPGSMAVGAVDVNDVIAGFSSTGPEVDVVAPGVAVKAPVPSGACTLCDPSGYMLLNGTSMATPHVSGVAALLMSRPVNPFTAAQAWNAITGTALDLGTAGHDTVYGYGRVDALAASNSTPTDPPPPPPPPPVDDVPPSVAITSPLYLQRVQPNTLVTIRASASDNVGVARVEFYVDLVGKCVDTTAPFTCNWIVPKGRGLYYLIEAYAFDAAGNYAGVYTIVYTR